ncbi:MAG: hypothetical protein ACXW32_08825, partial [Limisphaerales bacterium]
MKLRPLVTRFSLSTALFWLLAASLPHLNDARAATNYTETFLPGVQSARSFGRALDIEGDTLAVSLAPSFEWGGIYIYKFLENSWVRTATLDIGAEAGDDDFGADVALAGFLVAGTPLRNSVFKGSTIVLRSSTMGTDWLPQAALFPPNNSVIGRFGASVAKSGSTIAVVAPTEEQGAVYVYAGVGDPTWQLQARLTAADGGAIGDSFAGVELSNNTLLVDSGNDAYVFERSGTNWVFQARLSPPPLSGHTGRTALDQNVAVVNGYVFVRHGTKWVRSQESLPSSSTTGFGRAAAIEGNTLVISAQGAAFVFQYNGSSWVQVDQLTPSDPTGVSGEYGYTLAINQGRILVGDQNHNQSGEQTGAVHVWTPRAAPPSPASATAQHYNGFVVGINLTDPGSGYTYTPFVRLIGGGGIGASAVATVVSNRVESIEIVNSGIGYTSAPTVVIQSPAEGPGASEFLDLRITYAAVTFELIPGKRYTLESSFDRSTWTAVGEPFIAQQATLTEEFAVEQTGRFFRLTEIGASPSNFVAFAPTQDLIGSEQILAPPVPTENREFGRSVAIDNDTTVASAWSTNTTEFGGGLGEIFFYDLNGTDWLLSQTYVHPRTLPDELGASLAIDGDVLVAGAPWFNLQRQIGGYAQQFVRQETNWVAADLLRGDQLYNVGPFGASVAVSGQTMAILNPEESVRNPENPSVELAVGAVYVHEPLLLTKLCATNSNTTNRFSAVALSGDTLLVASGNDAVVFTRTGAQWDFHSVLSPSGTNFSSLALDGNIAVVNGYVFLRRGLQWTE